MDHSDIKVAFGQKVRVLRQRSKLTQEDFARQIGLDRSYIGGVERGERNISLENIWLICQGLQVRLAELFDIHPPDCISERRQSSRRKL